MSMFESNNRHMLKKDAIKLVLENLTGAIDVDSLDGKNATYDVEWNNTKILVKSAKLSKKASQSKPKWYYSITERDRMTADFFVLFAIKGNWVEAVFAVPKQFLPATYITISNLNGSMRYGRFRTSVQDLASKIESVRKELPKLNRISAQAKA